MLKWENASAISILNSLTILIVCIVPFSISISVPLSLYAFSSHFFYIWFQWMHFHILDRWPKTAEPCKTQRAIMLLFLFLLYVWWKEQCKELTALTKKKKEIIPHNDLFYGWKKKKQYPDELLNRICVALIGHFWSELRKSKPNNFSWWH